MRCPRLRLFAVSFTRLCRRYQFRTAQFRRKVSLWRVKAPRVTTFTTTRLSPVTRRKRCAGSGRPGESTRRGASCGSRWPRPSASWACPSPQAQIAELKGAVDDIDFDRAAQYERELRHDVMAHVHAYRDRCPNAGGIIHLGATSCYVTDNTDLILMREGLEILRGRLVTAIDVLAKFAAANRDLPCLGFTHLQPAQPTTVGKRATLWCYDLVLDLEEIEHRLARLKFRGAKGTTGTQASFLALFDGDHAKVEALDLPRRRKNGIWRKLSRHGPDLFA